LCQSLTRDRALIVGIGRNQAGIDGKSPLVSTRRLNSRSARVLPNGKQSWEKI
jgi:hypothetical protein